MYYPILSYVANPNGKVIMASPTWVSGWVIDTITGNYTWNGTDSYRAVDLNADANFAPGWFSD